MFRAPGPRIDSARPLSKTASASHSSLPLACRTEYRRHASLLFSSPYKRPFPQPLSFHIDLSCRGVASLVHIPHLSPHITGYSLSNLFSNLRTLWRAPISQLPSIQQLPHSLPKTTRGGGTPCQSLCSLRLCVISFVVFLPLLLASTPSALAWGCRGHETVAALAEKHLTPEAKIGRASCRERV